MSQSANTPGTSAAADSSAGAGDGAGDRRPTVAVIGASGDRRKFGNKCVRAYLEAGYRVFPVNPGGGTIEGQEVCARIGEVPVDLDRIALYLPPPKTRALLPEIAAKGAVDGVFFNPGTWTDEILAEARQLGIQARPECAIVALGMTPAQFPA